VLDRLGDIVCWMFVAGGLLEKVSLELGLALKSMIAFGGGGAVVLGLACQTPLENLVSGAAPEIDAVDRADDLSLSSRERRVRIASEMCSSRHPPLGATTTLRPHRRHTSAPVGVLIGVTNPFGVGDEVSLDDGIEGYIEQVGWSVFAATTQATAPPHAAGLPIESVVIRPPREGSSSSMTRCLPYRPLLDARQVSDSAAREGR
jgi:hypothetical protein